MRKTVLLPVFVMLGIYAALASAGESDRTPPPVETFMHEAAGINFFVQVSGDGPDLILVPSGQGDSGSYKLIMDILAHEFRVITFDMPGFSRSGPPPTWDDMSAATLGNQVAVLARSLGVEQASWYGSSSGGQAVLSVVADHPELVRNAVVHESALMGDIPVSPYQEPFNTWFPKLYQMREQQFGSLAAAERAALEQGDNSLILIPENIKLLDEGYIERRSNSLQVWYDHYAYPDVPCCQRTYSGEELNRAPVTVTVGMQSNSWPVAGSLATAARGNLEVVWLPAKHFPYISIPEVVADCANTCDKS